MFSKKFIGIGIAIFFLSACSSAPYFVKRQNHKLIFYARIPKAKQVYFVSSITGFKRIKARRVKNGLWKVEVPFKPGLVKYFYVVDGHVFIPECKVKQRDGFGGEDCIYVAKRM